jgi:hypothetical protein
MSSRFSSLLGVCLIISILGPMLASAAIDQRVVVRTGDWIEYNSAVTGFAPAESNITGSRLEVLSVEGTEIQVKVTTNYADGNISARQLILDESIGALGDVLIVPANLNVGDQFHDRVQGNFTAATEEQRTLAGVQRTVVSAQKGETTYSWDKQTGVMVEADSVFKDFRLDTKIASTNIWQLKTAGLDPIEQYAIIAVLLVVVLVVVSLQVLARRTQK